MNINNYFSNFKLPEYKDVTSKDVINDFKKVSESFPEMIEPNEIEKQQWLNELAVERFVNTIIEKIKTETSINYHEI